uniref:Uncharacterized protein n=1 Tax=Aegilops tauschii subsp. strangulata TaxID=200361 RepID=A0A452ZTK0_AEGTS
CELVLFGRCHCSPPCLACTQGIPRPKMDLTCQYACAAWWNQSYASCHCSKLLSGALDAGLAFMAVLIYLCLELDNITLNWWGNVSDGCPLASCPTAKGIIVHGCPVHN